MAPDQLSLSPPSVVTAYGMPLRPPLPLTGAQCPLPPPQGTASRIEGVGFEALAADTLAQHGIAYHGHLWPQDSADAQELPNPGDYHFR